MARTSELGGGSKTAFLPGWNISNDYSASNYYPPTIPGIVYANAANAVKADLVVYFPFLCRTTHTFTKLAFYNSGTGDSGDKLRMGLYNSASGRPTTLIVDGGEITLGGAAALNESTISQTLIAGTLYFMAITANGSITGPVQSSTPRVMDALVDIGTPSPSAYPSVGVGYEESRAYAALPASAGTLVYLGVGVTGNNALMWLKG